MILQILNYEKMRQSMNDNISWNWLRRLLGFSYDKVIYYSRNKADTMYGGCNEIVGWYIVNFDPNGLSYDSIGPYDSKREAKFYIMHKLRYGKI